MARAEIQVTLREEKTHPVYCDPEQPVCGTVHVTPDGEVRCNHLYVRLKWHTEGRGDRDGKTVAEVDLFQGTLWADVKSSHEFRFDAPREPWSYAGHYVSIVWEIEVDVDVPWSVNPRHRQPFILAPPDGPSTAPP